MTGCSHRPVHEGLPNLSSCSITITQAGQPLEGAVVTLTPKEGNAQWIVGGRTDVKGVAKILTQMKYSGAPAGNYKVRISKTVTEFGPPAPPKSEDQEGDTPSTTFTLIPLKFDDVRETPHEITITDGGKNTAAFDVGAAVREKIR